MYFCHYFIISTDNITFISSICWMSLFHYGVIWALSMHRPWAVPLPESLHVFSTRLCLHIFKMSTCFPIVSVESWVSTESAPKPLFNLFILHSNKSLSIFNCRVKSFPVEFAVIQENWHHTDSSYDHHPDQKYRYFMAPKAWTTLH